ncbi:MAG: DUF2634 domain-containing protein [Oscillospiraceae bacterium]|jgi:hypothetical protein|nr:DUF2634 domain-containing protein [Oscillospiraceae bacterium]
MLPKSNIDLANGIVFQDQPSLTWIADPVTNRLRGRGGGWEAIRQAVEVIVNVERFKWQIYTPNFGTDYDGLLGTEPGYAASELQRRLEDAFLPDNRILGIKDFIWSFEDTSLSAAFTVLTVFGDVPGSMEVTLT